MGSSGPFDCGFRIKRLGPGHHLRLGALLIVTLIAAVTASNYVTFKPRKTIQKLHDGSDIYPSVAWSGKFFGLVYTETDQFGDLKLKFRRLGANGDPVDQPQTITDHMDRAQIIWREDQQDWVIVYDRYLNYFSSGIYLQSISESGVISPAHQIYGSINWKTLPKFVWDADRSQFAIGYFHGVSGIFNGGLPVLQLVDSNFNLIGTEISVSSFTASELKANLLGLALNPNNGDIGVAYYNKYADPYKTYFALIGTDGAIKIQDLEIGTGHDCNIFWNGMGWSFLSVGPTGHIGDGDLFLAPISAHGDPGSSIRLTHFGFTGGDQIAYSIMYNSTQRRCAVAAAGIKDGKYPIVYFDFDLSGSVSQPITLLHQEALHSVLVYSQDHIFVLGRYYDPGISKNLLWIRMGRSISRFDPKVGPL